MNRYENYGLVECCVENKWEKDSCGTGTSFTCKSLRFPRPALAIFSYWLKLDFRFQIVCNSYFEKPIIYCYVERVNMISSRLFYHFNYFFPGLLATLYPKENILMNLIPDPQCKPSLYLYKTCCELRALKKENTTFYKFHINKYDQLEISENHFWNFHCT